MVGMGKMKMVTRDRELGSAIGLALLLAVQDLTYFLASPLAGVLADRIDRKRLMVVADLARAVLCLGFLFVRSADAVWSPAMAGLSPRQFIADCRWQRTMPTISVWPFPG